MSKFNSVRTVKKEKFYNTANAVNLAGGPAYTVSDRYELVSLLLTSFVEDKYYESASDQLDRLENLVKRMVKNDAKFLAQAAYYSRHVFGMRSISNALAAFIGRYATGDWKRQFFAVYPRRVDDVTEVLARFVVDGELSKLPNALKRGFAEALGNFDAYQLAKYRSDGKTVSLVDAVNLLHPYPTAKNGTITVTREAYIKAGGKKNRSNRKQLNISAFEALTLGLLKNTETWEARVSDAGQKAETEDDFSVLKGDAYADLLESGKMGYFAILRNLRNILETAPDTVDLVVGKLVDSEFIRNSLVLPFRFVTAFDAIRDINVSARVKNKVIAALNQALDLSVLNVPEFPGTTLVALDVSGSMEGKPSEIGSLFAAMICRRNPKADLMVFDNRSRLVDLPRNQNIIEFAKSIPFDGGGTNFHSIFDVPSAYDRIIVLSDMQGWIGYQSPENTRLAYARRVGKNPTIYSFDLNGYGTLEFPADKTYAIAGYSDKTLEMMGHFEKDKDALIQEIQKMDF